jgi:PHS family inorganic phosphate transporter-like MFS transporter
MPKLSQVAFLATPIPLSKSRPLQVRLLFSLAQPSHETNTREGTVIGQIGFGVLADIVGRKRMYGLELMVIIFATLAQALSAASPAITITGIIIFWRVIMGIGIGGDYPLSSIITSE